MSANSAFHIAVLAGDGIGPEVMAPTLDILRRIEATTPSLKFRFTEAAAGAGHYKETGKSMPESTIKLCRGSRRHPARRLRTAERALSRQHRDHAAGRTALHLRSLCRRAAGAAHSRRAEPDRRRRRARHRFRADPRVDGRPVRLHGQRRGDRRRGARDSCGDTQDHRAPVRLLTQADRTAQEARPSRPAHAGRQGQCVQGFQLAARYLRRAQNEIPRGQNRPALCRCLRRA